MIAEHFERRLRWKGSVVDFQRKPMKSSLASLYQAVEVEQSPPPLLIGERCNANGSRAFRERLLADDFEGCLEIAKEQEAEGAHVVDLCVAYAGRNELRDLLALVPLMARHLRLPLCIDSTTPECIEAVLRIYPGRCLINSINLEDGGRTLDRVVPMIRRYGAATIALTIDESGMAMTADAKVAVARKIYERAVIRHGLRPSDIFFDPLTFTVGSGDETLRDAAVQTLEAIRRIKRELPGVYTVLGLSNISFGLPAHARRILNSVFLHDAVEAGLDAAIVHAGRILPLNSIPEADREVCRDLLYNRVRDPSTTPLAAFLAHFGARRDEPATENTGGTTRPSPAEEALYQKVLRGEKDGLEDLLAVLLLRRRPVNIINEILIPAMRHVGELFGRGEILLPFVLQSAEVMKRAVQYLEPYMDRAAEQRSVSILLATVQGDVHDIGKNLVDIILSNNGYKVYNLGIKVPAETIIAKARELKVDLIGLSGLLVKSALVMRDSMPQYRAAGLGVPILLGGAALTPKFVAEECVPLYDQPVVYCADAFAGLRAVREYEAGTLRSTTWKPPAVGASTSTAVAESSSAEVEIRRDIPIPTPPFWGARHVHGLDVQALIRYINIEALFRGRWGYRRGRLSREEYRELIESKVRPKFEAIIRECVEKQLARPAVAYGYYRCHGEGNSLWVEHEGRTYQLRFPRRTVPPRLCIADYFRPAADGGDVVGFFVATIGSEMAEYIRRLYESNEYQDYLLWHGFSVELTDALAEYWHERMRDELGIGTQRPASLEGYVVQDYQGSRYGFGYPSCPDLSAHAIVFQLLDPGQIGVTLTESYEMVPEQSTSALVAHHPQAKYFNI